MISDLWDVDLREKALGSGSCPQIEEMLPVQFHAVHVSIKAQGVGKGCVGDMFHSAVVLSDV